MCVILEQACDWILAKFLLPFYGPGRSRCQLKRKRKDAFLTK